MSIKTNIGKGKVLCIDFDAVIHGYSHGWKDGSIYDEPVEGAKEALEELIDSGYEVLIYSTRCNPEYLEPGDPDRVEAVKDYLKKHNIPYSKIHTGSKPKAFAYIDDRAISFRGDWKDTLEKVKVFETWNRPGAKSSAELEKEKNI